MTHYELELAILKDFIDLYHAEFIGRIKIEDLDPIGYKVSLYLDNSEYPLCIMADLPDKEFLCYIKEEIRSRKLIKLQHFALTKLSPEYNQVMCMPNVRIIKPSRPSNALAETSLPELKTNLKEWIGTLEEFNALPKHYDSVIYSIIV